jgi:hypothetical protein
MPPLPNRDRCNAYRVWEGKEFPCIAEHKGRYTHTGSVDWGFCKFGAEYEAIAAKYGRYGRYGVCPKKYDCGQPLGHPGACDNYPASGDRDWMSRRRTY